MDLSVVWHTSRVHQSTAYFCHERLLTSCGRRKMPPLQRALSEQQDHLLDLGPLVTVALV
jgi:hypothetical protein